MRVTALACFPPAGVVGRNNPFGGQGVRPTWTLDWRLIHGRAKNRVSSLGDDSYRPAKLPSGAARNGLVSAEQAAVSFWCPGQLDWLLGRGSAAASFMSGWDRPMGRCLPPPPTNQQHWRVYHLAPPTTTTMEGDTRWRPRKYVHTIGLPAPITCPIPCPGYRHFRICVDCEHKRTIRAGVGVHSELADLHRVLRGGGLSVKGGWLKR